MADSAIVLVLLGLVAAGTLTTTAIFLTTAGDLRRVLQQLSRFLSHCDQTCKETERMLGVARHLLTRTDHAAARVEEVVEKGCTAAETALSQISFLKGKVVSLWAGRNGHRGGRSRSRKVYRNGNH